ncbi:MAG: type II toxin-antitoxin system VapC family toxin [Betaproteobacteria bacterium]
MIVLDTHALVFDALSPSRLSRPARNAIELAFERRELACSDISLWETAMLIARGRLNPQIDARQFLDDMLLSRRIEVLPITAEIAVLSQSDMFVHGDPADRLIAATAHFHQVPLVTSDARLRKVRALATIW